MAMWWIWLLPVAVGAGVWAWARRLSEPDLGVTRADRDDLDRLAQAILHEHFSAKHAALEGRLRTLAARGIPPRAITPSGDQRYWLLRFADGSEVPVTSRRPGDAGQLNLYLHSRAPVDLTGWALQQGELVLTFDAGGRQLCLVALPDR